MSGQTHILKYLDRACPLLMIVTVVLLAGCQRHEPIDYSGPLAEWPHWGGSESGVRFSPLTQITPQNVSHLHEAWRYRMGGPPPDRPRPWMLEVTPIVAEGKMYLCTPLNRVVALDPESGKELWSYDPKLAWQKVTTHFNCRGVTFYRDAQAASHAECAARIFTGTLDARLIALDALTGKPCRNFGRDGTVDLLGALGKTRDVEYSVTSPPVIAAGQVILGAHVSDFDGSDVPAGVIRAFDVHTGALTWAWNPLPPGQTDAQLAPPGATYARGTVNAWGVFSVDPEHGLVFIPTGNPPSDWYGGARHGLDYYGSSVVALEAATGRVVWHFQTVHHDLWDFDVSAQPVLMDFPTAQGRVPAVVQGTKQGNIYILNRLTGEPLVPVEERPVPQVGAVEGETPALTQPFPVNPAYVFYPGDLSEKNMWGFTPWDRAQCRKKIHGLLNQGIYTLPSLRGTLTFPPGSGMLSWGGLAIDTSRDILIVDTMRVASLMTLVPTQEADRRIKQGETMTKPEDTPYASKGEILRSPFGAPCNAPPWGTLTAIDLKAGKRLWEIPLGSTRDQAPFPIWRNLGVPVVGGPIVTASGLTFIAATSDNFIRAFDTATGQKLWQARLPAGGQAIPMTYRLRPQGKQYVAIAAGGHQPLGTTLGDYLIVYALKE